MQKFCGAGFAAGSFIVSECGIGSNKYIILDAQSVPELHTAFHCDAVADHDVVFDENVIADVAVATNVGVWQYMCESPDACSRANLRTFADALWMHKIIHLLLPG